MSLDEDWELELAAALPKIELHLHLDGSLSTGKSDFSNFFCSP
jgi:hypothetical protein